MKNGEFDLGFKNLVFKGRRENEGHSRQMVHHRQMFPPCLKNKNLVQMHKVDK